MNVLATVVFVAFLALVFVAIWSDLKRALDRRVEEDAAPRPRAQNARPAIKSLVDVTPLQLVTPHGVEIPSDLLQGDIDLGDALDWLDYVETLG